MKGAVAKENVIEIIKNSFGQNFLGEQDKKLYVLADDGGEKVQIAISLTCPKTGLEVSDAEPRSETVERPATVEVTKEETETLSALLKKLGL